MKQFYLLSTLLCALAISNPVSAQITIDEVKTDPSERILKNEVRPTTVDAQSYFSRARYRAERAAIRKERNTLEFGGGILGSVASYSDSWIETSGGDNSIGLAATLFLHHTFTKQRFTIETKFDAKFGYNRMNIEVAGDGGSTTSEATWYKNQDEFQISTNPAYIINKSWQVGSIIKFRSQFANGYVSRSQQTADDRKSTFMSPGYLDISGGFTYTCPLERFPIKINLSPIALAPYSSKAPRSAATDGTTNRAGRLTAFRMRTKPRNTRAVPQSRSTSTGRSAKRAFSATAPRSSPSWAGCRI